DPAASAHQELGAHLDRNQARTGAPIHTRTGEQQRNTRSTARDCDLSDEQGVALGRDQRAGVSALQRDLAPLSGWRELPTEAGTARARQADRPTGAARLPGWAAPTGDGPARAERAQREHRASGAKRARTAQRAIGDGQRAARTENGPQRATGGPPGDAATGRTTARQHGGPRPVRAGGGGWTPSPAKPG